MTIAHGGVLQNIHSALEPKKSKIGKKDSGSQECRMQLRREPVENEGYLLPTSSKTRRIERGVGGGGISVLPDAGADH